VPKSDLEETFAWQLQAAGVCPWEREYRFAPPRRWRSDFAWPAQMLLVEVDGGGWVYGRHNRPQGQQKDFEKHNEATVRGFRVLRGNAAMVEDGSLLAIVEQVLAGS
jgi:very-short-patch-repair endonuclease